MRRARAAILASIRAHAAAYRAIHAARPDARVGIADYLRAFDPIRRWQPLDRLWASIQDYGVNWAYLDALHRGVFWGPLPRTRIPEAARTMDFVGVNYYTRSLTGFSLLHPRRLFSRSVVPAGATVSDGAYGEVFPEGLLRVLRRVRGYGLPVYITENGLPDEDDDLRPAFLIDHLKAVWHAMQEGCDARGYFHWSLVDNFEWAEGWTLRFGLIAMDPETQVRASRPSSALYADICRTGTLPTLAGGRVPAGSSQLV